MSDISNPLDLLIRGGTVIDGTCGPRYDADIGIRDGHIVAIGDLRRQGARRTFDAAGRVVAPGFIDAHTHDDLALLSTPDMSFKVSQGVTTVVTGNCGISPAPLSDSTPMPAPLSLVQLDSGGRFERFADYVHALREHPSAVNVAPLLGHTTLRARTMPNLDRPADAAEVAAMRGFVEEALAAGAIGVSTGTFYPPAAAASTEEIIEVCRPLTGSGGVYATHMRDESDRVMESLEETFRIGRELDVPVVISHHKVSGKPNFGRSPQTLARIGAAMRCQCVALDCYPYDAGSTMLRTDRGMADTRVVIASSEPYPRFAGRDLSDVAAEFGCDQQEAARRLQPATAIYFMMDEADVRRILAFGPTMIGSDGIPKGDKPHPRLWGTFPRVLGHYCRDLRLFPLETAVWKMTGLTARNFGLHGRGTLAPGQHADVVVFDPERVIDAATYEHPAQPALGIDAVFVGGELSWHAGGHTGARNGSVLTRDPRGAWRGLMPA